MDAITYDEIEEEFNWCLTEALRALKNGIWVDGHAAFGILPHHFEDGLCYVKDKLSLRFERGEWVLVWCGNQWKVREYGIVWALTKEGLMASLKRAKREEEAK